MNSSEYDNLLLFLIQIISIYNALMMGCNVRKIGVNKYELTIKRKDISEMNLTDFINNVVSFNITSNTYSALV